MVCRTNKISKNSRGKVLFINAVKEVTRKNAESFLEDEHITKIANAYDDYESILGFAKKATIKDIENNGYSLSIPLYVNEQTEGKQEEVYDLNKCCQDWLKSSNEMRKNYNELVAMIGKEG
jgi:type I restriction enzyme M protein